VAKGRVRGQGLQQREVAAQPVEGSDRRLGVRHPDMDVQAADRRGDGVAEQVADALVALLVGDLGVAFGGRRMGTRAEQPCAGVDDGPPQAVEHLDRLRRAGADVGDELELTRVQLALHRALHGPDPLLDGGRRVDLRPGRRIDQEQLLFDPDRERTARPERVPAQSRRPRRL
jgi:hypothetical protein